MMDDERTWLEAKVGISPEMADEFLELLAISDEFRDRLARDPIGTFRDYFIELPEGSLPDTIELPSKEESLRFLEDSRKQAYFPGPGPHPPGPVLGFAILYCVLGTVPLPSPPPPPPPPPSE